MFIPALITALLENRNFSMTVGGQTRDFLYRDDLIDALIVVAENSELTRGQIFNLGGGQTTRLVDLALMIGNILNKTELIKLGKLAYRNQEIMNYAVDISKIDQLLNWQPKVGLVTGIRQTIKYYHANNGGAA